VVIGEYLRGRFLPSGINARPCRRSCRCAPRCARCSQAFVKIREQAKAYLDKPSDLLAGLNLLSTTNLDYFNVG
jgi:hypothetical protein